MITLFRRFIAYLVVAIVVAGHSAVYSFDYFVYCNTRYEFCVQYPAYLIIDPPPENDDGRRFHDDFGFVMIVSGINNVLGDTLPAEMISQESIFDRITYRAKGDNWFVLSGYKGSQILYRKTYLEGEAINHLSVQYPLKYAEKYADIVKQISLSFKPGDLKKAH